MKDHILSHSGKLPTCQIGTCKDKNQGKGRSFKFGKNLKAHIKTSIRESTIITVSSVITPLIARATTKPIMLKTMGSSQTKNTFVMTVAKPLMANLF